MSEYKIPDPTKADDLDTYSAAETATGVIAILNLILATIAFAFMLGCTVTLPFHREFLFWDLLFWLTWVVVFGVIFFFAVLLFIGIFQNKPNYLLAYIAFAIMLDAALFCGVLHKDNQPRAAEGNLYARNLYFILWVLFRLYSGMIVVGCIVHAFLLFMVYRAWSAMRAKMENPEKTALIGQKSGHP